MSYPKFRNKKVSSDGHSFASKLEAAVYQMLKYEWENVEVQPSVYLTEARILYKPDFKVWQTNSELSGLYAEAKGFETDVWRIKRRLWEHYGPGRLQIYKGSHLRPVLAEVIVPKGDGK